MTGSTLATRLADVWELGPAFGWTWKILQWPVIFAMVSVAIAFIYHFAPDVRQEWVWLTPGSVLATTLWLLASLGFKYYVAHWGAYTETYGLLGAVMILLLWFYISGLVILIGAEMNVEIEHAGERGPRRRIGDRTFAGVERRRQAG